MPLLLDNSELEKRVRSLAPEAIEELQRIIVEGAGPDSDTVLRAIENVLDRIGLGRQSKAEIRQVVSLDPETVELLRGAEAVLRAAEARLGSQLLLPSLPDEEDKS